MMRKIISVQSQPESIIMGRKFKKLKQMLAKQVDAQEVTAFVDGSFKRPEDRQKAYLMMVNWIEEQRLLLHYARRMGRKVALFIIFIIVIIFGK